MRRTAEDAKNGIIAEYDPADFSKEFLLGSDSDGYERRDKVTAVVECPLCGKELSMYSETDCWTEGDGGNWEHSEYGLPMAECCGLIFADDFDGTIVFHFDQNDSEDAEDS